jgi:hypothetical protein
VREIVVTVDDATTLVGRPLDALKPDPNARWQSRDLFDVLAGAPTTAPAVHAPATLGVESIGRLLPTYDEHQAIRHTIVEAGMNVYEAFRQTMCGTARRLEVRCADDDGRIDRVADARPEGADE